MKKIAALTLLELLVVLAIVGIIMMMALPRFELLFSSVRSEEAKNQLTFLWSLQKGYHLRNAKYGTDLSSLKFEHPALVSVGGDAHYRIEIMAATESEFIARATAITDFNGNGQYNVWEINQDKQLSERVSD